MEYVFMRPELTVTYVIYLIGCFAIGMGLTALVTTITRGRRGPH